MGSTGSEFSFEQHIKQRKLLVANLTAPVLEALLDRSTAGELISELVRQ
jgi:hypothetical protein